MTYDNFNPLFHEPGVYIPRVRPFDMEHLPFLYRWYFTDEELIDLVSVDGLPDLHDLNASVIFNINPKIHKRQDFQLLYGKSGWLRVKLGCFGQPPFQNSYLLYAAFSDIGIPVEFAVLNSLFDSVSEVESLERIPKAFEHRLEEDLDKCVQLSLEHQKASIKARRNQDIADVQSPFVEFAAQSKLRSKNLNNKLSSLQFEGESADSTKKIKLLKLKNEANRQLLEAEAGQLPTLRKLLTRAADAIRDFRTVTLYTIRWSVKRPKTNR